MSVHEVMVPRRLLRVTARIPRSLERWLLVIVTLSRLLYFLLGVRFDDSSVYLSVQQFLDPRLLTHDTVRSIWYLHSQPPLMNAWAAVVLRLPRSTRIPIYTILAFGLALLLAWTLFRLLVAFGAGPKTALVVTVLFAVSPPVVLWENTLMYTYVVAVLLLVAAYMVLCFGRTGSVRYLCGALLAATVVVLTRSTYHFFWLAGIVLLCAVAYPRWRRRTLAVAVLPLALAGGWYLKNLILFQVPVASSWTGLNLAHATFVWLTPEERTRLVCERVVSPIALVPPFAHPDELAPRFVRPHTTGVPAVDDWYKSNTNSVFINPNFNSSVYLDASPKYAREVAKFIFRRPAEYSRVLGYASRFALLPGSDFLLLQGNRHKIRTIDDAFNHFLFIEPTIYRASVPAPNMNGNAGRWAPSPSEFSFTIVLMYALALFGGPFLLAHLWRRNTPLFVTAVYAWVTLGMLTFAAVVLETGENNRLRFEGDPLALVLAVAVAVHLLSAAGRNRHSEVDTQPPEPRNRNARPSETVP